LKLRELGHFPMFDHVFARVHFVCNRGVSHELCRHRIGIGLAQESTRYCNYADDRFGNEVAFIRPFWLVPGTRRHDRWIDFCQQCERAYLDDIADGGTPDESRGYLTNDLKTEVIITATFTAWRHFFKMRAKNRKAHKQMRQVMVPIRDMFAARFPEIFGDLVDENTTIPCPPPAPETVSVEIPKPPKLPSICKHEVE
jgi:thymidylate synthase (FAD)